MNGLLQEIINTNTGYQACVDMTFEIKEEYKPFDHPYLKYLAKHYINDHGYVDVTYTLADWWSGLKIPKLCVRWD